MQSQKQVWLLYFAFYQNFIFTFCFGGCKNRILIDTIQGRKLKNDLRDKSFNSLEYFVLKKSIYINLMQLNSYKIINVNRPDHQKNLYLT